MVDRLATVTPFLDSMFIDQVLTLNATRSNSPAGAKPATTPKPRHGPVAPGPGGPGRRPPRHAIRLASVGLELQVIRRTADAAGPKAQAGTRMKVSSPVSSMIQLRPTGPHIAGKGHAD